MFRLRGKPNYWRIIVALVLFLSLALNILQYKDIRFMEESFRYFKADLCPGSLSGIGKNSS